MSQIMLQPQSDDNLAALVNLAIQNQLKIMLNGINKTKRKLHELEQENGMSTNEFYDLYISGKLGDDIKYIRWAGEYETLKKLEQDYQVLENVKLCS